MHSVVQLLQLALQLINLVKSGKVQFVEQLIGCNRYRVGHFEIRHIGTDLHIGRDFHDIRIQPQIFSQSGQCKTDHHRAIPVADHFAVGNLHIGEDLILKEHTGQQCGTVADGFGLLEELAVCPLIENRGEHRHGDHENGLHAEFPC